MPVCIEMYSANSSLVNGTKSLVNNRAREKWLTLRKAMNRGSLRPPPAGRRPTRDPLEFGHLRLALEGGAPPARVAHPPHRSRRRVRPCLAHTPLQLVGVEDELVRLPEERVRAARSHRDRESRRLRARAPARTVPTVRLRAPGSPWSNTASHALAYAVPGPRPGPRTRRRVSWRSTSRCRTGRVVRAHHPRAALRPPAGTCPRGDRRDRCGPSCSPRGRSPAGRRTA